MGPAHQKQGQTDNRFPETKPKHGCNFHQRKSIFYPCEAFSGVRQHSMGSSHPGKCTETRDGATVGCQICQEQTPKHLQCNRYAQHPEMAKSARQEKRCQVMHDV